MTACDTINLELIAAFSVTILSPLLMQLVRRMFFTGTKSANRIETGGIVLHMSRKN